LAGCPISVDPALDGCRELGSILKLIEHERSAVIVQEQFRILARVFDIDHRIENHDVRASSEEMIDQSALADLPGAADHHRRKGLKELP
jgi:hypothetical protein